MDIPKSSPDCRITPLVLNTEHYTLSQAHYRLGGEFSTFSATAAWFDQSHFMLLFFSSLFILPFIYSMSFTERAEQGRYQLLTMVSTSGT